MSVTKTTKSASAAPISKEDFVRQYMASLAQNKAPRKSLTDRVLNYAEDRLIGAVRSSQRVGYRIKAAWEIAEQIGEVAYAEEHARWAAELAERQGLV